MPVARFGEIELYPHQVPHAAALHNIIRRRGAALDTSDTGTGKTFTALATCAMLGLQPIVICPKAVSVAWQDAARAFGMRRAFVSNYEQYTLGKTDYYTPPAKQDKRARGVWHLPPGVMLIWDEAHYLKSWKSNRTKMAFASLQTPARALYLSATIANRVQDMVFAGRAVGLFASLSNYMISRRCWQDNFYKWHAPGCGARRNPAGCNCNEAASIGTELRAVLYNGVNPHAARMPRSSIANLPELVVRIEQVRGAVSAMGRIGQAYHEQRQKLATAHDRLDALRAKIDNGIATTEEKEEAARLRGDLLAQYTHARRIAEYHKTKYIIDEAKAEIEAGSSVVVFVNFKQTVATVATELQRAGVRTGIIAGEFAPDERGDIGGGVITDRQQTIDMFMRDELRAVVCTIAAGGVGISLHDTRGQYPRLAIINYDWDATHLRQAIGRVNRAGAKTPAVCRILYVAGTIEEKIVQAVYKKIKVIDIFNNEVSSDGSS